MSNTQTILLNGRRYDALTGKLIKDEEDNHKVVLQSNPKHAYVHQNAHHRRVDGVFSGESNRRLFESAKKLHLSTEKIHKKHPIAPHVSRSTQHSKTLMRRAVKKPNESRLKYQQAAKSHVNEAISKSMAATAPAKAAVISHARSIQRSDFVTRFNTLTTPSEGSLVKPDPNIMQTSANSEVHLKNLDQLAQIEANPKMDELFSEAVLKLDDSELPTKRHELRFYDKLADKLRVSVKMLFAISVILFVIIFGTLSSIIFSNNISIFVADTRTGIHGILPTFTPKGFAINSINYATGNPTGTISINYHSSNGRSYNIIEQATSWDSQSLANSVVVPDVGDNYKSYQVGGRSVFMYNNSAVWVDSGIYYTLNNHANLSANQINRIVNTT